MPNSSWRTFATGPRQFVVHEALEMRDDPVAGGIIGIVVHAQDQGHVRVRGRCRDDHPLGTGGEVLGRVVPLSEQPRGLHGDLSPQTLPGKLRRISLGEHRGALSGHHEIVAVDLDRVRIGTVNRVVLEQMGEGLRIHHVVDADDLDIPVAHRAEGEATDTTEPVDSDLDGHSFLPGCGG
jgi:hypothetical protein